MSMKLTSFTYSPLAVASALRRASEARCMARSAYGKDGILPYATVHCIGASISPCLNHRLTSDWKVGVTSHTLVHRELQQRS